MKQRPEAGHALPWILGCGLFLGAFTPVDARIADREREPVIVRMDASTIPRWVDQSLGTSSFELWKYTTASTWVLVPYQIDELLFPEPREVRSLLTDSQYADRRVCNGDPAGSVPPPGPGPCEFRFVLQGESPPGGVLSRGDELVFLAGSTGRCDAPTGSWASASEHDAYRQKIILRDPPEQGCLYLYRRISGTPGTIPDLIDYDPVGDGVPAACVPHADACGAVIGSTHDFDGDGADDIPAYRMDFLGNWSMDRLEIGSTQGSATDDLLDINKTRCTSPAETERAWDQSEPPQPPWSIFGCAIFEGYIDGPVRVVRVIQGAISGATTRKVEFIYPGEYTGLVYLRVHQIQGPTYQYFDLLESVASPSSDRARIYTKDHNGAGFYDEVNGVPPGNPQPDPLDWYQLSSPSGSFLSFYGREQGGRLERGANGEPLYSGRYEDTTTKTWVVGFPAEYDQEVGERGAFRTELPAVTGGANGSQNFEHCDDPWGDNITVIAERTLVMLDAGKADGSAGKNEMDRRARGVLSQAIVEQERDAPEGPGAPCIPILSASYGHDLGPVDLQRSGCTSSVGWNLYQEMGAGVRRRLATLGPNEIFRDVNLALNEQRTYTAASLDRAGIEGGLSSPVTVLYNDTDPPTAPETVLASVSGVTVEVSWTVPTSPDVSGYRVLVSDAPGGPYTQTHSGLLSAMRQSWAFGVVQSGTYYVVVHSRDYAGNESPASAEIQVVVP